MAKFPFSDFHSFKDYVVYVQTYLPNRFPAREAVGPNDQWSLELAFRGLRLGLKLAVEEKGSRQVFSDCEKLVQGAYNDYQAGRAREGFFRLEEANQLLKKVPSQ